MSERLSVLVIRHDPTVSQEVAIRERLGAIAAIEGTGQEVVVAHTGTGSTVALFEALAEGGS